MDTDDLSEKAYGIFVHAARMCDTLKAELGALSCECKNEDEWLDRVQSHLRKIVKDPAGYVKTWDLDEEEGIDKSQMRTIARKLSQRVDEIKSQ